MDSLKRRWKQVPVAVRKPTVLIVGCIFLLAAAATGWLPGPGGIPLFLIGIAILATEFTWAERIRNYILRWVHAFGRWYRVHRITGTALLVALACLAIGGFYYFILR
jgi:uncharacterized protein (TIGR02611 family)